MSGVFWYHFSVRLVEQELLKNSAGKLVGVVPACFRPQSDSNCVPLRNAASGKPLDESPTKGHQENHDNKKLQLTVGGILEDPLQLHNRGVASKALHIHKESEGFGGRIAYTVVLEGICRISLDHLDTHGPYFVAKVTQLDNIPSGAYH